MKLLLDRPMLIPNPGQTFGVKVSAGTSGTISKFYCKQYANSHSPMFPMLNLKQLMLTPRYPGDSDLLWFTQSTLAIVMN